MSTPRSFMCLKRWSFLLGAGAGIFAAGFVAGVSEPATLGALTRVIRSARTPPRFPSSPFEYLPGEADVVMLGDSITAGTQWTELLPGIKVVNRGTDSDTTWTLSERLDEILRRRPKKIFVMIGVNDVRSHRSPAEILGDYRRILRRLSASGADVNVQSILLLGRGAEGVRLNSSIVAINEQLRALCAEMSAHYVDLTPRLCSAGELDPRLTVDGLHLNGQGYLIWADVLRELLR